MPAHRSQDAPGHTPGSIWILGAGAMGRLWAGYLPTGIPAFVRRPHTAPKATSYQLFDLTGHCRDVIVADARNTPRAPLLLLVTTKAQDAMPALASQISDLPADVPIVLFQNGLGSQQAIAERWPGRPVLAASSTEGANRPDGDLTIHAGGGQTWIGPLTPSANRHLAWVTRTLATSSRPVFCEPHILQRLWDKLVINAGINAFTALLDCPNGALPGYDLYRHNIDGLCRELHLLMETEGFLSPGPQQLRTRIEAVAKATARNFSSMRSDVAHNRLTEINYINGYVCRRGQELGLTLPVNQMLTEQVTALSGSTYYG